MGRRALGRPSTAMADEENEADEADEARPTPDVPAPEAPLPPPRRLVVADRVTVERPSVRSGWFPRLTAAAPMGAAVLWFVSLRQVDLTQMTDLGLVSVLPPLFGVSLGLLVVGFLTELFRPVSRGWVLGLHVAVLVLVMHGTVPLLYSEPRYSYVYKHIAVTRAVAASGSTDRSIDIYQNWSGFPGFFAYLSTVTGVDAMSYANAAQLFFAAANVLAVRFAARSMITDTRVLALTTWVYVLADWIGQNYFAPQALAYLLSLLAIGVILNGLPARASAFSRRLAVTARAWRERLPLMRPAPDLVPEVGPAHGELRLSERLAALVVVTLLLAIVLTHPLTPYVVIVWLCVLVVLGRWRLWWLPPLALALAVASTLSAHAWLGAHVNLFSDVGSAATNAKGTSGALPGSPQHQVVTWASRLLSVGLWFLAAIAVWRRRRSGRRDLTLPALWCSPFLVVLAQSYGGEIIYRAYLFSTPWCAMLVAGVLIGYRGRPRYWRRAVLVAGSVTMVILFLLAYFGLERSNMVRPEEVAASTWFEENAPPGSILATVAGEFPAEVTARYGDHRTPWGTWGASIIGDNPQFMHREATREDLPAMVSFLQGYGAPTVYLVTSPGQEAYASAFGLMPPGATTRLSTMLQADPNFEVVHRNGPVTVLRVRNDGPAPP